jgi:diazepam-binding inhibitor (GABA receptor modulating acyl-CoA-binding protein)
LPLIDHLFLKDKPGIFDLKGRYKWDAWTKLKGMTKEAAQAAYIEHVKGLIAKYGLRKE